MCERKGRQTRNAEEKTGKQIVTKRSLKQKARLRLREIENKWGTRIQVEKKGGTMDVRQKTRMDAFHQDVFYFIIRLRCDLVSPLSATFEIAIVM